MKTKLQLNIRSQPDDTTCGPTCLHAVYDFYGDGISLQRVVEETTALQEGGTLGVLLANHALRRGYKVLIYTYNLSVFDPTWFELGRTQLKDKLRAQQMAKKDPKLHFATRAYLEFLEEGGELRFEDLTTGLIRKYLKRRIPVLTGLSATFLYRAARETHDEGEVDDVAGVPVGHFVVLCGYESGKRKVFVADPSESNPYSDGNFYETDIDRVLCAILLGIVTYDANLVLIQKGRGSSWNR